MRREQIQNEIKALRVALTPCDHTNLDNPNLCIVEIRDLRPGGSRGVAETIYHCERCGAHWSEKPAPEPGPEGRNGNE